MPNCVTYVPGILCNLCVGKLTYFSWLYGIGTKGLPIVRSPLVRGALYGFVGLWRWDHGTEVCWPLTMKSAWSDDLGDFLAQDLVDQKYQSMVCGHNCVRGKFSCVSWLLLLLHSGAVPAPYPDSVSPPTARDNPALLVLSGLWP